MGFEPTPQGFADLCTAIMLLRHLKLARQIGFEPTPKEVEAPCSHPFKLLPVILVGLAGGTRTPGQSVRGRCTLFH